MKTSRTRRTVHAIAAGLCALSLGAVSACSNDDSDTPSGLQTIANASSTASASPSSDSRPARGSTNDASMPEQTPSPSQAESTSSAVTSSSGKVDEHLEDIESALDNAFTQLWLKEAGDELFAKLEPYGVTPDGDDAFKTATHPSLFGMADNVELITAWQAKPFKCKPTSVEGADMYICTMYGDWAKQPAGPLRDWDMQEQDIKNFISQVMHGPNGSERAMQTITVAISLSEDHNTGKISLSDGDNFSMADYDPTAG